eukprot:99316_1
MANPNTPTYIMLAFYVLAMIIVTIIANRQNAKAATQSASNMVKTHFLASKSFGAVVLLLTTFASVFSGYTVVGVPNEAGMNGFTAIRWIGATAFVSLGFLIIFPRLRRISMEREYTSPGDFVYDRYRSKIVQLICTLCLCVPQLLYITVQLHALGATLAFFTNGELPFNTVVVVAAILILILEALGGMRTVAYTDVVQASVMIIIFTCFPIVLAVMYHGGYAGMTVNTDELPCPNDRSYTNENGTLIESGCLNYMPGPAIKGTVHNIASEFYLRSPAPLTIINYFLFSVSLLSFALNPHVLQRAMAAEHDWQVRFVMLAMSFTPYICQVPGVLIGISYLANWKSLEMPASLFPAFQSTLAVFVDQGGFREFLGYIAMLAAVAGIMSTADSALIGVSNTFVCDIFKNWLTPNISQRYIVWIGKAVSLVTICIAIGIAIDLQNQSEKLGEPVSYGVLLTTQQGILWQAFPAYAFGLYTNVSWKSILAGLLFGILLEIILFGLTFSDTSPFIAADPAFEKLESSWSALCGVTLNLIVIGITHLIVGGDDVSEPIGHDRIATDEINDNDNGLKDDTNKSYYDLQVLSIDKIREIMTGIGEPLTQYYGFFVIMMAVCCIVTCFHWIGEVDPELERIYGEEGVKQLLYNGTVQKVIGGFPEWAFASMIWYGIATGFGIVAVWLWNTDAVHEGRQAIPVQSGEIEMDENIIDENDKTALTNNNDNCALIANNDNQQGQAITTADV